MQTQLFKDLKRIITKMRIKVIRGEMTDSESEQDVFMNEIIDLNGELEEMISLRWGEKEI